MCAPGAGHFRHPAVAGVAAAHPEIAELEVNPVLVGPDGVVALDARAVAP